MGERLRRVRLRTRDVRADTLAIVAGITVAALAVGVIAVRRLVVPMLGVLVAVVPFVMAVLVGLRRGDVCAVAVVGPNDRFRVRFSSVGMVAAPAHLPASERPKDDRQG